MPAPKKYIDMKLSSLHSHVLFMFNQLKEKYCTFGLDNLYISARFVQEAFFSKSAVMVHGVASKSGRGLPRYVIQEEIKNAKEAEKVRGTTKAEEKMLLSHYEFWSQIALAWLTGTKETTGNQTSESTKKCKVLDDSSLSTCQPLVLALPSH
jgi:hypothetical protein